MPAILSSFPGKTWVHPSCFIDPRLKKVDDQLDVTVNDRSAISKSVKNVDTGKIHNLFYESHKEVDKIAEKLEWSQQVISNDLAELTKNARSGENGNPDPLRFADVWSTSKAKEKEYK